MHVEGRWRGVGGDEGVDVGEGFEEGEEGAWALEDEGGAAGGDFGEAADELDGVAEALLGVDEEGFSAGVFAVPEGGGEGARGDGEAGGFPAPLVFGPSFAEVSVEEEHVGEVVVGFGEIGFEGDGSAEFFEGVIEELEINEGGAEEAVGRGRNGG